MQVIRLWHAPGAARCSSGDWGRWPAAQVITSRMRYISSQREAPIRIVGLATSLANAKDLGEWIGATSHGLFNFPPGGSPLPVITSGRPLRCMQRAAQAAAVTRLYVRTQVQAVFGSADLCAPAIQHALLSYSPLIVYIHMSHRAMACVLTMHWRCSVLGRPPRPNACRLHAAR